MSDDEQRYTEERRQANYKRTLRGAAILTRYHEMTGSAEELANRSADRPDARVRDPQSADQFRGRA